MLRCTPATRSDGRVRAPTAGPSWRSFSTGDGFYWIDLGALDARRVLLLMDPITTRRVDAVAVSDDGEDTWTMNNQPTTGIPTDEFGSLVALNETARSHRGRMKSRLGRPVRIEPIAVGTQQGHDPAGIAHLQDLIEGSAATVRTGIGASTMSMAPLRRPAICATTTSTAGYATTATGVRCRLVYRTNDGPRHADALGGCQRLNDDPGPNLGVVRLLSYPTQWLRSALCVAGTNTGAPAPAQSSCRSACDSAKCLTTTGAGDGLRPLCGGTFDMGCTAAQQATRY